jgi:large subunit ribosomal protein L4
MNAEAIGEIDLSDGIFGAEISRPAMHMAVKSYLSNQRQGTQSALTRAEVSGGGRKPWKQKGTGRARQGSIRSPQWTHGGIVFAPKPRDYTLNITKKLRRLALKSALSVKAAENDIIVVDNIALDEIKTKAVAKMLEAFKIDSKALIVMPGVDEKVVKSARNIPSVKTALASDINTYEPLFHDKIIITKDAVAKIEEVYA